MDRHAPKRPAAVREGEPPPEARRAPLHRQVREAIRRQVRAGELQSYAAGPLFRAPINGSNGPACLALGGVLNASSQCTFPGRSNAVGSQGFPGLPPSAASGNRRHNFAGYVEADADIAADEQVVAHLELGGEHRETLVGRGIRDADRPDDDVADERGAQRDT